MKKRVFLLALCILMLTIAVCLFAACDKDETPDKSDGSTEGGTTDGGASGGETNGGSTSGGTTGGENDGEGGSDTQQPIKHTVTFKADGVTVETVEFTESDTSVTPPSVPNKTGYTGVWESFTLGTENITVNAVYTPITYTAIFKADGVAVGTREFTVETVSITTPSIPDKAGYVAIWESYSLIADNITVNAIYTAGEYLVTFKADGTEIGKVAFTYGDTEIVEPNVPFKQCYVGAWEDYTLGAENITVNAVYTLSHSALTHTARIEPKCNATGNIEYWSCSGCDKFFSDAAGTNVITDKSSVVLPVVDCSYTNNTCIWCGNKKPSEGLVYTLSDDGTYYIATGMGPCTDTEIVIARKYEDLPVKEIGWAAFYGALITDVTIPDSVEKIATGAFEDCSSLTNVIFNENSRLLIVNDYAFSGCKSLTRLVLPEGVGQIGYKAFYNTSMRTFTIPSSVKTLDNYVFSGCFKLVEVINKTNLYVGKNTHGLNALEVHGGESKIVNKDGYLFITSESVNYLLGYVGSETELVLPNGYNGENYKIDGAAFSENHTIKSVVIPSKVTEVGSSAFSECESLVSVNIPSSVETLGGCAFYFCSSLKTVTFEENCRIPEIGYDTFRGCTSLEEITLPDSITSIGDEAFFYCPMLERITLPEGIVSIGREIFSHCEKLSTVNYLGTEGQWDKITKADRWDYNAGSYTLICAEPVECKSFTYHASIDSQCNKNGNIDYWECDDCGKYFSDADGNTEIVDKASVVLPTVDCVYLSGKCIWCGQKEGSTGLAYSLSSNGSYYTVTGIGACSDYDIVIPNMYGGKPVKAIAAQAFKNQKHITGVVIGNNVETIGNNAFELCRGLVSVTVGKGVTTMGTDVFYHCTKLVEVINKSELSITKGSADNGRVANYALIVHTGKTQIVNQNGFLFFENDNGDNLLVGYAGTATHLVFPDSISGEGYKIYKYAFAERTEITKITLCAGVTDILYRAFWKCTSLATIEYIGSESQWNAVVKEENWAQESGSYTVVCTGCAGGCENLTYCERVEAQCNATGNIEYWVCDECGKYFSDANGRLEITDKRNVVITVGCSYVDNVCKWCGSEPESKGLAYTISSDGSYYIVSGIGTCTDVKIVIPSVYNAKPIKSVATEAFKNQKHIVSVVLGNNVETIGDRAFEYCRGLVSVTVGSSVKSIGTDAFNHCNKLIETINKSTLSMSSGSNENGRVAQFALIVHNEKTKIVEKNNYLFYEDESGVIYLVGYVGTAVELIFPDDYNGENYVIYRYVFAERADITKITLGTGVAGINYRAFWRCTGLTTIDFRGTVSQWETVVKEDKWAQEAGSCTISYTCGAVCDSLVHHDRKEAQCNMTGNIEYWSCSECNKYYADSSGGTEIKNKQSVVIQRVDCFYVNDVCKWCGIGRASEGLKYTLSADGSGYSVAGIGTCTDSDVVIPAMYNGLPVKYIAENAFHYCNQLITVTVGKNVVGINDYVFSASKNLTTVIIYECVTNISSTAFSGCGALTNIIVSSENEKFKSIDGNLYSKDGKTLIKYAIGKRNTTFTVPEEVITIGDYAFEGCKSLTNIVLGNNVKNIRVAALSFTGITSITIPSSVTTIGYGGLMGCTDLIVINYRGTEEQWNAISKGTHWDKYYDNDTYTKINYTVTYNYTGE